MDFKPDAIWIGSMSSIERKVKAAMKTALKNEGGNVSALAEKAGITRNLVYDIINGENVTVKKWAAIERKLKIDICKM